jgi:hypothetical protein
MASIGPLYGRIQVRSPGRCYWRAAYAHTPASLVHAVSSKRGSFSGSVLPFFRTPAGIGTATAFAVAGTLSGEAPKGSFTRTRGDQRCSTFPPCFRWTPSRFPSISPSRVGSCVSNTPMLERCPGGSPAGAPSSSMIRMSELSLSMRGAPGFNDKSLIEYRP